MNFNKPQDALKHVSDELIFIAGHICQRSKVSELFQNDLLSVKCADKTVCWLWTNRQTVTEVLETHILVIRLVRAFRIYLLVCRLACKCQQYCTTFKISYK